MSTLQRAECQVRHAILQYKTSLSKNVNEKRNWDFFSQSTRTCNAIKSLKFSPSISATRNDIIIPGIGFNGLTTPYKLALRPAVYGHRLSSVCSMDEEVVEDSDRSRFDDESLVSALGELSTGDAVEVAEETTCRQPESCLRCVVHNIPAELASEEKLTALLSPHVNVVNCEITEGIAGIHYSNKKITSN